MSYNIRKLYRMIGDFINQKRTGTDDEARTVNYLSNNLILRVQQRETEGISKLIDEIR